MAFPYTTIETFEDGTKGHFNTQTNAGMDFPHYTELARHPGLAMPYRGAYCARIDLAAAGSDGAWIQEEDWNLTNGTDSINLRLKFWLSKDAAMASGDEFSLIEFWASTNTDEACASIEYTDANGWRLGIGENDAPTVFTDLELGKWHDLEVFFDAHVSAGTLDAWFDGTAMTQVTGMSVSGNITSGIIGCSPGASFTPTAGILLIDQVIADISTASVRIGSGGPRYSVPQVLLETSGHVFVGHGIIDNVSLLSGGATDNVLQVWDTDTADTTNAVMKLELKNLTQYEMVDPAGVPVSLTKGCYISLSGTKPRALVTLHRAAGYGSEGAIRTVALG